MTSQPPATSRLHITPFSQELLPLVLGTSVRPLATDVSFHGIPTFPENNYGYVTLPTMEAEKIKKKLNGSILKGRKFKVESARPDKHQTNEGDGQKTKSSDKISSSKKSKKRKAEDNVLDGYELSPDRKVKRGWTESSNDKEERRKKEKRSKDKAEKKTKSQQNSKYTEKSECLFRTNLPPNKSSSTDDKSKKKAKKSKGAPETVVHEFSQTLTHPTFLRSNDGGNILTSTYEEGKGWVDVAGNLKEPASERIRKDKYRPGQVAGHKEKAKRDKSISATKAEKSIKTKAKAEPEAESTESEDWTSSSDSSSGSDSSNTEDDERTSDPEESEASEVSPEKQRQLESSNNPQRKEQELNAESEQQSEGLLEVNSQQQPTEVHPLEALFKRPADQNKPESDPPAQFSFFGQGDVDSEEEDDEAPTSKAPLTPFTKRDLRDRGLRSAAPTPDTSQVTRTINWNPEDQDDGYEGMDSPFTDSPMPRSATNMKEESDFAKWFWENRGDNNRAWKKRRRDAAKEQRQRENRRKGMKGKS
ncbi:hypothetical protein BDV06DRAFT_196509 [Aspergillus oleicola]